MEGTADNRSEQDARSRTPIERRPPDSTPLPDDQAIEPTYELPEEPEPTDLVPASSVPNIPQDSQDEGAQNGPSPADRMGQSLSKGLSAMRDVRAASRRHADARGQLRTLQRSLDEDVAVLEHRLAIEADYPQIVAAQSDIVAQQTARQERARKEEAHLVQQTSDLQAKLDALKARHEEELRPYRDLADSTKGRSDDAARALADARRSLKAAEKRLADETRKRDQDITSANRELDSAQTRLRDVQHQLDSLQTGENADPQMVARFQEELNSVETQASTAQERATRVASEGQQTVERAQDDVYALRAARDRASATADAAKREATSTREELDQRVRAAESEERQISDQLRSLNDALGTARRDIEDSEKQRAAAQALLDEAEQIHAAPQETISLREHIARTQEEMEDLQEEVDQLASQEQELRRSTRGSRIVLVAALVALVLAVILVVWLILKR